MKGEVEGKIVCKCLMALPLFWQPALPPSHLSASAIIYSGIIKPPTILSGIVYMLQISSTLLHDNLSTLLKQCVREIVPYAVKIWGGGGLLGEHLTNLTVVRRWMAGRPTPAFLQVELDNPFTNCMTIVASPYQPDNSHRTTVS